MLSLYVNATANFVHFARDLSKPARALLLTCKQTVLHGVQTSVVFVLLNLCCVYYNCIDNESFELLTPNLIEELIPKVGLRLKFLRHFNKFCGSCNQSEFGRSVSHINNDNTSSIVIPNSDLEATLTTVDSSFQLFEPILVQSNVREFSNIEIEDVTLTANSEHLEDANSNVLEKDCVQHRDLKNLINRTVQGKIIFHAFQQHKRLSAEQRNKLTELVIENELEGDLNKKISSERFESLAESISQFFPGECKEVYYMKVRVNKNNNCIRFVGRGKLFCKYYNLRKQLKLAGAIPCKRKLPESDNEEGSDSEDDADQIEYLEWLKRNKEPFDKVQDLWRKTLKNRQVMLKDCSISNYFKKFLALCEGNGYILLNIDYDTIYPENNFLYSNWQDFFKKIVEYAKLHSKDKLVQRLLGEIDSNSLPEESKYNRILKILPYLVCPVPVARKWKPSKAEIDQAFILHVNNIQDLHGEIERRESKYQNLKLTFQPTPIIVGKDLDSVTHCYVKINSVLFEVETPLKAVEVTFKAIHVLNALYAVESEQVWLLIQKGVFKLNTKFDKQYTTVSLILSNL
ncbi:unnamed protein product [Brassicogethes aeneus]|uniref:Uncharacterized protein n=1 Tax=Brassicogethes aeneus TaxID=1431903 RepID=A0A9P0FG27_BRAAE|nr:unnamed protein product [Brassicogethes aeneus]